MYTVEKHLTLDHVQRERTPAEDEDYEVLPGFQKDNQIEESSSNTVANTDGAVSNENSLSNPNESRVAKKNPVNGVNNENSLSSTNESRMSKKNTVNPDSEVNENILL